MKAVKKTIGIVLIAILLVVCIVADAAAIRFSTVITRFWSGTFGTVQTESDDTQLKATDAAADSWEDFSLKNSLRLKTSRCSAIYTTSYTTTKISMIPYTIF